MKRIISAALTGAACLTVASPAFGAGMGVNTHIDHKYPVDSNLSLVASGSFEWVRDSIGWTGVESVIGKKSIQDYNKHWAKQLEDKGINQLLVLGYGNDIAYDVESKFVMPTRDNKEYYNGFLDYVRFVVDSVGDYTDAYEIWNEPNYATFNYNLSEADGTEYAKMYLDCVKIIREKDPTARILCGAMMGDSTAARRYAGQIFEYIKTYGDVNELIDVFSIHKYSDDAEGAYADALWKWETVFDKYGYTGEVWMTENGASTFAGDGLTEDEQAAYVARCMVQWEKYLLESGRRGENFWYDLKNDGETADNKEHNYGLADFAYNSKPAFNTAKLYNKLTNSKEQVNYTESGNGYVAEYSDGVDKAFVIYGTDGVQKVSLSGDKVYVYDASGEVTEELTEFNGTKEFAVSGEPVFVQCINDSLKIIKADYNTNKNAIDVEGTAPGAESVIISLESDGTVLQSNSVKVNPDNVFRKTFTAINGGICVIRISDGKSEITKEIKCMKYAYEKKAPSGAAVAYDVTTKSGTVRATVSDAVDGEIVLVSVASADKTAEEMKISDFAYIGEAVVQSGSINESFNLPENAKGAYKVLIARQNTESAGTSDFMANEWNWAYVSMLDSEDKNGAVLVNASLKNFNGVPKSAVVIVAEYSSDNKLIKVTGESYTIPANQTEAVSCTLTVEKQGDTAYFKAMVWDSFGNIMPLY